MAFGTDRQTGLAQGLRPQHDLEKRGAPSAETIAVALASVKGVFGLAAGDHLSAG